MTKARNLANFVSDGNPLADGTIDVADINGVTATATEINILDGVLATTAEINHVDGVTSPIQTQLNFKVIKTSDTGSAVIPIGTSLQRDVTPSTGFLRYNLDESSFEGYNGVEWGAVGGGSVVTKTYDARSDLRAIDGPVELLCVVESLGVFVWELGSTQIDDDETCFATATGRWLLYAAAWDLVSEYVATESSDINDVIFVGTVFNSIANLGANTTVVITASVLGASVGDTVSVAPPVSFDGRVILTARVSGQNTVTIIFGNSGAQSLNIATGFYNILVTKGSF